MCIRDRSSSNSDENVVVDTKRLGRVEKFRSAKKDWNDWSFSFRAFLGGVHPNAVEALAWAAQQADTVNSATIDLEAEAALLQTFDGQIYTALSLLVQGDALEKLRQVPDGNGLEAWRRNQDMRHVANLYLEEKQDLSDDRDGAVPTEVEQRLLAL